MIRPTSMCNLLIGFVIQSVLVLETTTAQEPYTGESPKEIRFADGEGATEGRVLIRVAENLRWETMCFARGDGVTRGYIAQWMCGRLGFPLACGIEEAGLNRTEEREWDIFSKRYNASCVDSDATYESCDFYGPYEICSHDHDLWLTCGYSGMSQYELRLSGPDNVVQNDGGLLQGRCGANYDWGGLCGDTFDWATAGHVVCRHLGVSEYAISSSGVEIVSDRASSDSPQYTVYVDLVCVGTENRVQDCRMEPRTSCKSHAILDCLTENVLNGTLFGENTTITFDVIASERGPRILRFPVDPGVDAVCHPALANGFTTDFLFMACQRHRNTCRNFTSKVPGQSTSVVGGVRLACFGYPKDFRTVGCSSDWSRSETWEDGAEPWEWPYYEQERRECIKGHDFLLYCGIPDEEFTTNPYFSEPINRLPMYAVDSHHEPLCHSECNRLMSGCGCRCDALCLKFGDCCYDFAYKCFSQNSEVSRGTSNEYLLMQDMYECVLLPNERYGLKGYVLVSRCPAAWPDEETREGCEAVVDPNDIIGSIPVYDDQSQKHYKNVFCAICHGRSLEGLRKWEIAVELKESDDSTERSLTRIPNFNIVVRGYPTGRWIIKPPEEGAKPRCCSTPVNVTKSCPNEFTGTALAGLCATYLDTFRVGTVWYKNLHCVLCNAQQTLYKVCKEFPSAVPEVCQEIGVPLCGRIFPSVLGVGGSGVDEFISIDVLFDLSPSSTQYSQKSCNDGYIYDPFLQRCREFTCNIGFEIAEGRCKTTPAQTPLNGTESSGCLLGMLNESNAQAVKEEGNESSIYILLDSFDDAAAFKEMLVKALSINELSNATKVAVCNGSSVYLLVPFSASQFVECAWSIISASDVPFNQDRKNSSNNGHFLAVVTFEYSSKDKVYLKTTAPKVCLEIGKLNCSMLLILERVGFEQVPRNDMPAIQVRSTGKIVLEDDFVLLSDGRAVVCSLLESPEGLPVVEGFEPQLRRALSVAGNAVSLCSLAATFITYSALPSLRNLAGKSLMNLVVALFIAMLFFLLSIWLSENPIACIVGAVIAHYTWLVAFLWMSVLSYSVARVLGTLSRPQQARPSEDRRLLMSYAGFAWGLPFLVICICLILQFCGCTNLPPIYGEYGFCWISNQTVLLVVFVAPVAVCLMVNVGLFVFSVVNLRQSREKSKFARKESEVESIATELGISAKLSGLVGITWVLGFLKQLLNGNLVVTYINIVLNYLQGFFIFASFCLNRRVRALWREKIWGARHKDKP